MDLFIYYNYNHRFKMKLTYVLNNVKIIVNLCFVSAIEEYSLFNVLTKL